jgi:hypothetical protein
MPSLAALVKRIAPSVVNIEGRGRVAAAPGTKHQRAGKGIDRLLAARNDVHTFGSGVVFDARRGLIITNSHIIDHADEITVKLTDGRALPARRVGADPETDVAADRRRARPLQSRRRRARSARWSGRSPRSRDAARSASRADRTSAASWWRSWASMPAWIIARATSSANSSITRMVRWTSISRIKIRASLSEWCVQSDHASLRSEI